MGKGDSVSGGLRDTHCFITAQLTRAVEQISKAVQTGTRNSDIPGGQCVKCHLNDGKGLFIAQFPFCGTIVLAHAVSGEGRADIFPLPSLLPSKMTVQRPRFAVKGPSCSESEVEAPSLGLHSPLDLRETQALGKAAFSLDVPARLDFRPAVALAVWQRVSGSPSTESVSVFLADAGRLHESCLPVTLDYYKRCCLNTKWYC